MCVWLYSATSTFGRMTGVFCLLLWYWKNIERKVSTESQLWRRNTPAVPVGWGSNLQPSNHESSTWPLSYVPATLWTAAALSLGALSALDMIQFLAFRLGFHKFVGAVRKAIHVLISQRKETNKTNISASADHFFLLVAGHNQQADNSEKLTKPSLLLRVISSLFVCFACCQEFCVCHFCYPGSFTFILPSPLPR